MFKIAINKFIKKENGISLIEVAIGLIVIGLIVTPLMQDYNIRIKKESNNMTRGSLGNIKGSINQYYASGNGYYPCPASLILGENATGFGKSGDCTLANVKLCTDPLWLTNEGICKTDNTNNAVIIGGTPFTTLKMQQENALDYWGNKIIYAVTFEQTNNLTFAANSGQIRVNAVDDPVAPTNGGLPEEKASDIDFFLFSTGASGTGGFTKDGINISICSSAANGYETENCDFDNRFFDDRNAFSEKAGASFYDDIILEQESVPEATWFQHSNSNFVITLNDAIGIGTTTPSETIDVVGDIRTDGGVHSDAICDTNSANCFDPELITGTKDAMECDAGLTLAGDQAVMMLANNRVYCNITKDSNGNPIGDGEVIAVDTNVIKANTCNDDELISGIDANGDFKCVIP